MKKHFGEYRRLARGLYSCSSLWAGPDHFVYVKGSGFLMPFVEEYKRFGYKDVQAITRARSMVYLWSSLLFGLGAALSAALIFLPDYSAPVTIVMFIFMIPVLAVCLPCFVVTMARGPTCRCRIQTAVGSVLIRPLSRERAAKKAILEMSALIAEHQADLVSWHQVEGEAEGRWDVSAAETETAPQAATPGIRPERRMTRSKVLVPTFVLMLPFGVIWLAYAYVPVWWPLILAGVLEFALLLGIAASLVEQMRGYSPGSILAILWAALVQQIGLMLAAFVVYIVWSINNGMARSAGGPEVFANLLERLDTSVFVYNFSVINGLFSVLLGLAGLSQVWRYHSRMAGGPSPPLPASKPVEVPAPRAREAVQRSEGIDEY